MVCIIHEVVQGDFCTAVEKCLYSSWKQIQLTFIVALVLEIVEQPLLKDLAIFEKVFAI